MDTEAKETFVQELRKVAKRYEKTFSEKEEWQGMNVDQIKDSLRHYYLSTTQNLKIISAVVQTDEDREEAMRLVDVALQNMNDKYKAAIRELLIAAFGLQFGGYFTNDFPKQTT